MATEAPQTDSPETAQGNCLMGNLGWMLDQANHALGCEVAAALSPLDLGQRGFCVLAAAVAEALRPGATPETVVAECLRLAKDGTRTAIEAVATAAARLAELESPVPMGTLPAIANSKPEFSDGPSASWIAQITPLT